MTDLIAVPQASQWLRLKALVLDSVSSPITRRLLGNAPAIASLPHLENSRAGALPSKPKDFRPAWASTSAVSALQGKVWTTQRIELNFEVRSPPPAYNQSYATDHVGRALS